MVVDKGWIISSLSLCFDISAWTNLVLPIKGDMVRYICPRHGHGGLSRDLFMRSSPVLSLLYVWDIVVLYNAKLPVFENLFPFLFFIHDIKDIVSPWHYLYNDINVFKDGYLYHLFFYYHAYLTYSSWSAGKGSVVCSSACRVEFLMYLQTNTCSNIHVWSLSTQGGQSSLVFANR